MKKKVSSALSLLIIVIAIVWQWGGQKVSPIPAETSSQRIQLPDLDNTQLLAAYKNRVAKAQIKGSGLIVKVLKDDLEGSRHQRLIVKVNENQTLLIAHNINSDKYSIRS